MAVVDPMVCMLEETSSAEVSCVKYNSTGKRLVCTTTDGGIVVMEMDPRGGWRVEEGGEIKDKVLCTVDCMRLLVCRKYCMCQACAVNCTVLCCKRFTLPVCTCVFAML